MARLSIHALGPLKISLDRQPVSGFVSDKVRALLVYLALSPGHPHRREALAGLLWPEFPERSARTNLRNSLYNLRKVLGERTGAGDSVASPPFLNVTQQTIQLNPQSDYWLDVTAFEGLLAPVPSTREGLEEAVGLVRGPFLEGFSLADAAPFEEWLLLRREHYGRQLVEALDSLAGMHEGEGAYDQALVHARRRVELEPWQEEGQRQLMRLLALSGQRSEALAQYEKFCRSLLAGLGAEPSTETQALRDGILSGDLAPELNMHRAPFWNLPAATTPFFGRTDELAALEAKLAEPDARLVTLTGLGGSGKTRLALEVGTRLAERDRQALTGQTTLAFSHGVVFVPLAAIDSVEGLDAALADALRLRLEGGRDQLLEFLRRKQLLLILDNVEQLRASAGFLAEMLCTAPGVKILATSRERLELQGEHVLPLGGLPYPDEGGPHAGTRGFDMDALLESYPALQLLVGAVQRVRPGFIPSAPELQAMLGICRLVDGLPLAVELAASWADALSLEDILLEAQRGLDFWRTDWPDMPERQRSMRGVFEVSWRRLSLAEQATFSSLTVFRGGFTRAAAGRVLDGGQTVSALLVALLRKSCLQYDRGRDRYSIHELLRQYGAEKLAQAPAREALTRDRHSAYYACRLSGWEADLASSRMLAALSEMEAESENIRAAWYQAVEQTQVERLDGAMEGLVQFYRLGARFQDAVHALGAAAATTAAAGSIAQKSTDRAECLRVSVRALIWQSGFQRILGQPDAARRKQQQCLAALKDPILTGCDTRLERAILAYLMGMTTDNEAQGVLQFEQGFALFRDLDLQWWMAHALAAWGAASIGLGSFREARQRLEEGLAIWQALGDQSGVAESLGGLAYLARLEGNFEEAVCFARQGYDAALEAGTRHRAGLNQTHLGIALLYSARFSEAHAVSEQGLALLSDIGHRFNIIGAHTILASIDIHRGCCEEGRDHAETGLALARKHSAPNLASQNLLLIGCLDLAGGALASALQHVEDSIAVWEGDDRATHMSQVFAVRALVAHELGEVREARQYLFQALNLAVDLGAVPPLLWALPAAAFLLAGQGAIERAVELYALPSRYPFVAKSHWFEDVVGRQIAVFAATLPADRVAILEERGQARDLDVTAGELLAELRA